MLQFWFHGFVITLAAAASFEHNNHTRNEETVPNWISWTSAFNIDLFEKLRRLSGLSALRADESDLMRRQMITVRLSLKPGLINLLSVWAQLGRDSSYWERVCVFV